MEAESLNQCTRDIINYLKPQLVSGIESAQIPPMDPYYLPHVRISNVQVERLLINLDLRKAKVTGLTKFDITDMKVDREMQTFHVEARIPFLSIQSEYDLNGRYGPIGIRGSGYFSSDVRK